MNYFNSEAFLIIETDASDYIIKGVLKKKTEREKRVIEFYS